MDETDRSDPRIRVLAAARQDLAADGSPINRTWDRLHPADQKVSLHEAERFLTAAIRAGLIPPGGAPASLLSEAERKFLEYALEHAADRMAITPAEFTAEDRAALGSLRKLADGEAS